MSRTVAGDRTISASSLPPGAGAVRESCGVRARKAATSSGVTAGGLLDDDRHCLGVGDRDRRRRADVAGAGADEAVVGGLLEDVRRTSR